VEIRIELQEQREKYDGCVLDLEDSGIIQIVCDNLEKKRALIDLLTGMQVRKVDLIDLQKVDSTLTVKNYITFYTMVKGDFHETTTEEVIQLLKQAQIENLLDRTVNDLTKEEKIKIRCLASYMREITCLVGKDLLETLEWRQRDEVLLFLKKFFGNKQCLCLLFEKEEMCKNKVDSVLVI